MGKADSRLGRMGQAYLTRFAKKYYRIKVFLVLEKLTLFDSYSYGFDALKRFNIQFIKDSHLIFIVGNVLHFLNIKTFEQVHFHGKRQASIGCIAVNIYIILLYPWSLNLLIPY